MSNIASNTVCNVVGSTDRERHPPLYIAMLFTPQTRLYTRWCTLPRVCWQTYLSMLQGRPPCRHAPIYITTFFHRNIALDTRWYPLRAILLAYVFIHVVGSVDATGVINFIYIICVVIDIFYWIFALINVKINKGDDCLSLVFRGGFYET